MIEIEIVNDAVAAELDETFRVELIADPNRAFILDTSQEATVTIKDNDGKFSRATDLLSCWLDLEMQHLYHSGKPKKDSILTLCHLS